MTDIYEMRGGVLGMDLNPTEKLVLATMYSKSTRGWIYPYTIKYTAHLIGVSPRTAYDAAKRLKGKGYIVWERCGSAFNKYRYRITGFALEEIGRIEEERNGTLGISYM